MGESKEDHAGVCGYHLVSKCWLPDRWNHHQALRLIHHGTDVSIDDPSIRFHGLDVCQIGNKVNYFILYNI